MNQDFSLVGGSLLKIGVLGAGWMGGEVGRAWVRAGLEVMFSSRNLGRVKQEFADLSSRARVGTIDEVLSFADVILLTVPYAAIPEIGISFGKKLRAKLVIDATNPTSDLRSALAKEAFQRGVGKNTSMLLGGATVVRAFSCVDATQVKASSEGHRDKLGVPVAGDNTELVAMVERLVLAAGCEPVVVGGHNDAHRFERGTPAFRANTTAKELRAMLMPDADSE
jgi:8-hydroxy-5-deazaflavin:NADPH oxidoreductase